MYTLLRTFSAAVFSTVVAYLALVLLISLLSFGQFVSTLAVGIGIVGWFMGFVHVDLSQAGTCFEQAGNSGCDDIMEPLLAQTHEAVPLVMIYLGGVLLVSAFVYLSATALQRSGVRELVVRKLHAIDDFYIQQILGIEGFDRSRAGIGDDGVRYADDVLAREQTGNRGDARYSERSEGDRRKAAAKVSAKVSLYERWEPFYQVSAKPTFAGSILLAWRVGVIVFFVGATWFSLFSMQLWLLPLAIAAAAAFAFYSHDDRWKKIYTQFAGNDTNLVLVVVFAVVLDAIAYLVSLVVGMIVGSRVFSMNWIPHLAVFFWIAVAIALAVPLSNFFIVRHRENADADKEVSQLIRTRLARNVHGTHAFAVCVCGKTAILTLQEATKCEACGRPVDMSMSERVFHV